MTDFIPVARTSDIPPGQVRYFDLLGAPIAICHVEDGGFYAIDDECTHDGGSLNQGELDEDQIECPRHGARFNVRTGAVITLPATLPLHTYPVRIEGNQILVNPIPNPVVRR
ncbi:MAG: non-heme iron oxygenase ferredoxin subunit [Anaerolineae bacterium]|nr:non-heme iron oxygenase ferredoxin subunit [Anaerolineae bacterium]